MSVVSHDLAGEFTAARLEASTLHKVRRRIIPFLALLYLAEFIDRVQDYRVAEEKRAAFAKGVRRLVPEITNDDLAPDISGIRPKVQAPGEPMRDFIIREESDRGLPGLVNLIGIESPGLTSCLAIAKHVEAML